MTVERYDPPAASKHLALVNPTTDSWTAVLTDVIDLANNISQTEFVPQGLRGSTPKVVAAILHGRELGLPPMTALAHTSVINGRPGTSAEVMRALILQAGHDLHIERSDSHACTIKGQRAGWAEDRWTTVTFTIEDAAKAGLTQDKRTREGKVIPSMYKLWPQALLLARASTILARMIFADVIHGMRSTEELQDMTEPGEWVEPTPPPATSKVSRQGASPAPAVEGGTATAAPGGAAAPEGTGEVPQAEAAGEEQTPAASRKRAPLRPRGRATQPVPEPAPEPNPADEPAEAEEPVEAELVPEVPATPSNVTPLGAAKSAAKEGMVRTVQMQFERLLGKPVDREERLWYTGLIVGRSVESTNDLDGDDLRKLLKTLERLRNREQLEALNQGGE